MRGAHQPPLGDNDLSFKLRLWVDMTFQFKTWPLVPFLPVRNFKKRIHRNKAMRLYSSRCDAMQCNAMQYTPMRAAPSPQGLRCISDVTRDHSTEPSAAAAPPQASQPASQPSLSSPPLELELAVQTAARCLFVVSLDK